jgi:3alpha(or 20beta)-hydroxysteroid dehydrogenase
MGVLEGKVALVSGAARGMGENHTRRFVAEGASVVIGDLLDGEGKAVADELGDAARFVHLDVTSEDDWAAAAATATTEFGRLDVLVNNAGTVRLTPIIGGSLEDYLAVIMVNEVGVYLGMKAAAPAMADSGGGSIVNISSIDGIVGMATVAAYCASKFAVRGLTRVAALELAPLGIRCNSVHPGYIDTPMLRGGPDSDMATEAMFDAFVAQVPAGRMGVPNDITEMVLFLASEASSYCSGAEFVVDGGVIAGPINPGGPL